jgi:hypothetical protein
MYEITVTNMRRSIEQHPVAGKQSSMKAFADAYGFSRQNLVEVLGGKQDMSVALFLRLSAALKGRPEPVTTPGVERWSLRTWLAQDAFAIQSAMYEVNFEG